MCCFVIPGAHEAPWALHLRRGGRWGDNNYTHVDMKPYWGKSANTLIGQRYPSMHTCQSKLPYIHVILLWICNIATCSEDGFKIWYIGSIIAEQKRGN